MFISNGIVGRPVLIARVAAVAVVSAAVFVVTVVWVERNRVRLKWLIWGVTCAAALPVVFALYLYPLADPYSSSTDRAALERAATRINAARGDHEVPFPKGYVYVVERRAMPANKTRLDIHMSKRLVARVVGIDLIQLDGVAVELSDGRITRAWVNYF